MTLSATSSDSRSCIVNPPGFRSRGAPRVVVGRPLSIVIATEEGRDFGALLGPQRKHQKGGEEEDWQATVSMSCGAGHDHTPDATTVPAAMGRDR